MRDLSPRGHAIVEAIGDDSLAGSQVAGVQAPWGSQGSHCVFFFFFFFFFFLKYTYIIINIYSFFAALVF